MKVATISIFDNGKSPIPHIKYSPTDHDWPITISLTDHIACEYGSPQVNLYMNLKGLIQFKNAFLGSFNKAMKEAGYDK